jgi:hypothetical protein
MGYKNLLGNKSHSHEFCSEANRLLLCRTNHADPERTNCQKCMFRIAAEVQQICNGEGVCIREALEQWAVRAIPDSATFLDFCDALGVNAMELRDLIGVIKKAHEKAG